LKHLLTKTDFIQFLNCPKSLWLLKNKPEIYPFGEFSLFLEKLIEEGYEVEEYAMQLFPNGINLGSKSSIKLTRETIKEGKSDIFCQAAFKTEEDVFARIDILEKNEDGSFNIYEIKSSTEVKKNKQHNHIKDACFQKFVAEQVGYKISKVYIIHLNKEYVRKGEINPESLLTITDITDEVNKVFKTVSENIKAAVELLQKNKINENSCSCREKTRSNHCDAFNYFNKNLPEFPIYQIGRISEKKIKELIDMDLLDISKLGSNDIKLNDKQELQVLSVKNKEPIINYEEIKNKLNSLTFPLHFIDYETYASAIPRIDNIRPHQHIPFQVSVHTLYSESETDSNSPPPAKRGGKKLSNNKKTKIEHFEYLANKLELPEKMLALMKEFTGLNKGIFISWHASYEKGKNSEMIEMFPEYREYLIYMNENMFDLEDVFKEDYVDYRFKGYTSIKKVLPIIVPNLSYDELDVKNGTMALDLWGRIALKGEFEEGEKEKIRKNLLEYCKLDTWAMVEIYKFLKKLS
jgi:hypothetical protein